MLRTVRRLLLTSAAVAVLGIGLAALGRLVLGTLVALAGIAIAAVPWAIGWWGEHYLEAQKKSGIVGNRQRPQEAISREVVMAPRSGAGLRAMSALERT